MLEYKTEERKKCNRIDKCMIDSNRLLINAIYRAAVITLDKSKLIQAHQVYRLKVGTDGISILLKIANTDQELR